MQDKTRKQKVLLFIAIFSLVSVFPTTNTKAVTELKFKNGMFNVSWKHLPETEEIEFALSVRETGYMALGLTKTNSQMEGLDIVFVSVNSTNRIIKDFHAKDNKAKPTEDSQPNYTLISANQSNGVTTALVKRKLVTNDINDLQIKPGEKVYLAWATNSTNSDTLQYHSSHRGYSSEMLELVLSNNVTSTTPATEPSTTRKATPATTGNMITGSSILSILAILFALTAQ